MFTKNSVLLLEEERENVPRANSAAEQLTRIFHLASSSSRVTSE